MAAHSVNRRDLLTLSVAGIGIVWFAATNKKPAVHYTVPEVDLASAKALIDAGATVIDVRTASQFKVRHLPNAALISLEVLRVGIPASLLAAKESRIVIYCGDGTSTGPEATHILVQAGFTNVANMKSGIEGWSSAGLPTVQG